MSALVLRRLPSGAWALLAVPDPPPAAREEARRLPFLVPFPAVGGAR